MPHDALVIVPLYPTLDTLQEALRYAESRLPISNVNELHSVLFAYHNTLIKALYEFQRLHP